MPKLLGRRQIANGRRAKSAKAQSFHVSVCLSSFEEILPLRVIEQRHETEVHVQLLVAMEEGEAGVVGDKINL